MIDTMDRQNDADLMLRVGRGDAGAYAQLARQYMPKIYAVCYRTLGDKAAAEEVTQEVFLRLWTKSNQWQEDKGALGTWLYRIATNLCLDELRKLKVRSDTDFPESDAPPTPDQELVKDRKKQDLQQAVNALPDRQKMAVTLHYIGEQSYAQAAQIMDVSPEAFDGLLSRARGKLKSMLSKKWGVVATDDKRKIQT